MTTTDRDFLAVADCHVGNHGRFGGVFEGGMNDRCRMTIDALAGAVDACNAARLPLVICGDLFDTHDPAPPIVSAVMDQLDRLPRIEPRCVALVGNHDRASPGNHALAPLRYVRGVEVVDSPRLVRLPGGRDLACVPFLPGRSQELIPAALAGLGRARSLTIHAGVRDESTAWYLQEAEDAIDVDALASACGLAGVDRVFAGNWHSARSWTRRVRGPELYDFGAGSPWLDVVVTQVGGLCPTGFDNPGWDYGRVADSEGATRVVVPGPRFFRAGGSDDLLDQLEQVGPGCRVYAQVVTTVADLGAAARAIETLRAGGWLAAGGATADPAKADEARSAAAASAIRSARAGRAQSLAAYVQGCQLPPGADRPAVLRLCMEGMGIT